MSEFKSMGQSYGVSPAQIFIALAIGKDTLPILRVTKVKQVEEAMQAINIELTREKIYSIMVEKSESVPVGYKGKRKL